MTITAEPRLPFQQPRPASILRTRCPWTRWERDDLATLLRRKLNRNQILFPSVAIFGLRQLFKALSFVLSMLSKTINISFT